MARLFLSVFFIACSAAVFSQQKLLKKSWINISIEEFRDSDPLPDTTYLRYEFDNTHLNFSFDPGWNNSMQLPWSLRGKALTLGYDTWTIEHLSDTALTIYLKGYRRMKFIAEEYLTRFDEYLEPIGEHNGKPLYKANRVVTPRYKKNNPLGDDIRKQDLTDDYNIRKARTFLMSFIITEDGRVENPKILKGIIEGYDNGVVEELLKTRWRPAIHKGKAVQTLMYYEVKFLDSLIQY